VKRLILALILAPVLALAQDGDTARETAPAAAPDTATAADTGTATAAAAAAPAAAQESGGVKTLSGMSILGNEEAPKSLVIVPWKSSQLGDGIGVDNAMDDRARPVDRDVFMRELRYYELRSAAATEGS